MPRNTTRNHAGGEEGNRARRSRSRKQAASAAAAYTESAAPVEVRAMAAAAGAEGSATTSQPAIDRREIEELAYYYWLERGGQGGSPEDDWFRAEQELRRQRGLLSDQG